MTKNNMVAIFKKKAISAPPERLCLRLKEIRQQKGITLEEIAEKTKINKSYLRAIEECRFNDMPQAIVYQKNFIRSYAEALGLKPETFLTQYFIEEAKLDKKKHPQKAIRNNPLNNLPTILRYCFAIGLMIVMLGYLGLQVKRVIEPPELNIFSPPEGFIAKKEQILIVGETEKEIQVSINGKEIMNSENGQFRETVALAPGVNTITITANKKHGKSTVVVRHVVFKSN